MRIRRSSVWAAFAVVLVVLGVILGSWGRGVLAPGVSQTASAHPAPELAIEGNSLDPVQQPGVPGSVILSYAAKFVCLEPLQPGQLWFGTAAPILEEKTEVLIHNPNAYPVTFYKKAVRAPLEDTPEIAPGKWTRLELKPDYAVRVDCDDIARLLTGDPAATFIGTFGIGVKVEGFVVIGIGPQMVDNRQRFGFLDVTAEYNKGSEVLKKDIAYRPWWWWWWWPLPWRLGYAYQRIVPVERSANIDCRGLLYAALAEDVQKGDPATAQLTLAALEAGQRIDPTQPTQEEAPPALVALIGRCDKIDPQTASIDYVLVSNKGPTDPDPREGPTAQQAIVRYPWIPGRWYDLTVVMPQNRTVDLDAYIRQWHTQRWVDAGVEQSAAQSAMVYFFPWWCGWGYWWWWWWGNDCIDIAVGEGESIDVEQVTPTRVFMPVWPPTSTDQ